MKAKKVLKPAKLPTKWVELPNVTVRVRLIDQEKSCTHYEAEVKSNGKLIDTLAGGGTQELFLDFQKPLLDAINAELVKIGQKHEQKLITLEESDRETARVMEGVGKSREVVSVGSAI